MARAQLGRQDCRRGTCQPWACTEGLLQDSLGLAMASELLLPRPALGELHREGVLRRSAPSGMQV
eukprot:15472920-Alexandrium_andersonii.AAC.1